MTWVESIGDARGPACAPVPVVIGGSEDVHADARPTASDYGLDDAWLEKEAAEDAPPTESEDSLEVEYGDDRCRRRRARASRRQRDEDRVGYS